VHAAVFALQVVIAPVHPFNPMIVPTSGGNPIATARSWKVRRFVLIGTEIK